MKGDKKKKLPKQLFFLFFLPRPNQLTFYSIIIIFLFYLILIILIQFRFAEIMEKVEVQMEASAARLVELDVMIDEQKANRTTRDTTVDEVLARHPELAAQFDDDIANDRWFPSKNVADGLYTEENLAKWK